MNLTKLAEACRKCPFVDTCDHKQMEAEAYLQSAEMSNSISAAAPLILDVGKEEIKKQLYEHLYSNLGLRYGA